MASNLLVEESFDEELTGPVVVLPFIHEKHCVIAKYNGLFWIGFECPLVVLLGPVWGLAELVQENCVIAENSRVC